MKSVTEDNKENDNNQNILVKIFDWHKRTFLHPTTKSVGCGKSSIYRIKNYMYGGLVA